MFRQPAIRQVAARRAGASGGGGGENPLTFTQGLTRTGDTIRNDLITGKAGGQTITGGTAAAETLTLVATSHATPGRIILSSTTFFAGRAGLALGSKFGWADTSGVSNPAWQTGLELSPTGAVVLTSGALVAEVDHPSALGYGFMVRNSGGVSMLEIQGADGATRVGGATTIAPPLRTTGSPSLWTITGPAHTTLTASTEAVDVNVNLARTVQFATGALATQRAAVVRAPTYAFVGASVITTAATFAITGAPIQGANATITNPFALWVQAGLAAMDGGARTTTLQATDLVTFNPIATTSGQSTKFAVSPAADTGTTLNSEAIDVDFAFNRTRTWSTGAIATQRSFVVRPPTLAFVGASVVTTAATLAVVGPPAAGANATITTPLALWVQAGISSFAGGVFTPDVAGGATSTSGLNIRANQVGGPGTISFELASASFGMVDTTVASGASVTLDLWRVTGSTVTVSGGTNITTGLGFNYARLDPPVYSTSVTIGAGGVIPAAATLVVRGPPTITGGGSFAGGIGAVGLWVQAPSLGGVSAVFDGTVAIGTSASSTAGIRMEGTGGITFALTTDPMSMSLAGTQTLTKSNSGDLVIQCNTTGNFIFKGGAGNVEAFRILGTSNAGQLQIAAANLAANGAVATTMTSLGPTGSHTTIQEWLAIKGTGGALRWLPMY